MFKIIGFCLSFCNSCINPVALCLLSQQFRNYFNRYLFCCCTSPPPRSEASNYTETTNAANHIKMQRNGASETAMLPSESCL
jgi:gastrin-releasing peptide receptor